MNNNILPDNEVIDYESRLYVNPQTSLDEQNSFIDNLRNVQNANNAEINAQTYNLGTDISSSLGGLGNSMPYFTSRYQTPQTNAVVANLRATAMAQALNEAMGNEVAMWKQRYNRAYRDAQRRANMPSPTRDTIDGGVEEEVTGSEQFDVKQDINNYGYNTDIYNSTEVAHDNRSTERNKNIKVTKNSDGGIRNLTINGVNYSGREAKAKYRQLQRSGLVR